LATTRNPPGRGRCRRKVKSAPEAPAGEIVRRSGRVLWEFNKTGVGHCGWYMISFSTKPRFGRLDRSGVVHPDDIAGAGERLAVPVQP